MWGTQEMRIAQSRFNCVMKQIFYWKGYEWIIQRPDINEFLFDPTKIPNFSKFTWPNTSKYIHDLPAYPMWAECETTYSYEEFSRYSPIFRDRLVDIGLLPHHKITVSENYLEYKGLNAIWPFIFLKLTVKVKDEEIEEEYFCYDSHPRVNLDLKRLFGEHHLRLSKTLSRDPSVAWDWHDLYPTSA